MENRRLCLSHEVEGDKERANSVQESTSHGWFTQVQEDYRELEDFKLVGGDNTQEKHLLRRSLRSHLLVTCRCRRRLE